MQTFAHVQGDLLKIDDWLFFHGQETSLPFLPLVCQYLVQWKEESSIEIRDYVLIAALTAMDWE